MLKIPQLSIKSASELVELLESGLAVSTSEDQSENTKVLLANLKSVSEYLRETVEKFPKLEVRFRSQDLPQ